MKEKLRLAFEREIRSARESEEGQQREKAWRHLERAHILSQAHAAAHVRVHWLMFCFAWRGRDLREVLGQVPRLILAAPGSWTKRAPLGNTGGASVGIFTPMAVPPDLAELLDD